MAHNVAVFLDLDNLVIGARQANLAFNIRYILDAVLRLTEGRIVLRRAYGDSQQNRDLLRELAAAGFITQTNLSVNNFGKNLADMQITVDVMESLVDERPFHTYVLITGDQDFSPLTQALRKRDKQVIGIGVKHATSTAFASLCDLFLFYEDIVPPLILDKDKVEALLVSSLAGLEKEQKKVRASVLKQRMDELSQGAFSSSSFASKGFRQFLADFPDLVNLEQEESTLYVAGKSRKQQPDMPLRHQIYRTHLKKQRLRIVPAPVRLALLKELVNYLRSQSYEWRTLSNLLAGPGTEKEPATSKNTANAVLHLANEAGVVKVLAAETLALSHVELAICGDNLFQQALVRCDRTLLERIRALPEPFDLQEASLALYDTVRCAPYLQRVLATRLPPTC